MEDPIHTSDASFVVCKDKGYTLANTDGGWDEEVWQRYLEERVWVEGCSYKREGEDCPRGQRGPSVYDFETPVYHLLTLAREGIDAAVEQCDVEDDVKALLKKSVAIVNADGSVDDDCAPLTMTVKTRIYSLGAPRSVEVRHEYHKREGWDNDEYSQRVAWRLNYPAECGRRFMPPYKKDELGWRTMFHAYLDYPRGGASGRNMGVHSGGAAAASVAAGRGARGRARGRGRGKNNRRRPREEQLADGDTDGGTETGDSKLGLTEQDDDAQLSGLGTGNTPLGTPGAENSSGGTCNVGSSGNGATTAAGMGAAAATTKPAGFGQRGNCTLKQKWLMNPEDLEVIRDHLLAGSDLEDEVTLYQLLELLMSSVGIANGKVGEHEVGKPMYGKAFLEHYKRRLGGVGPGNRSGAGSQAVSEESEGEDPRRAQPTHKRARLSDSGRGTTPSGSVGAAYVSAPPAVYPPGAGFVPGGVYQGIPNYPFNGYVGSPLGYASGQGTAQSFPAGAPGFGYGVGFDGVPVPGVAVGGAGLSRFGGEGLRGSRQATPTSSWGGAGSAAGGEPAAVQQSLRGASRRKRGGGSRGSNRGLPPLVPQPVGLRTKVEVEAS